MRIFDGKEYRDLTQEEIEAIFNSDTPIETPKTTEERLTELEQAFSMLLEGILE